MRKVKDYLPIMDKTGVLFVQGGATPLRFPYVPF
jgi:hypothetical protein